MKILKAGDIAPDFMGVDQNGEPITLTQFKGKRVVIYFYPKDDTPGCTAEACNLRDNYNDLLAKGFEIIGVSPDAMASHKKFADKYKLPFRLISDTEKVILKTYNAWGEKKMYGKTYEGVLRKTFILSEDHKIEKIIEKVDTKDHTNQIYTELKF
ncbi:MAG: peroxiredoxin [Bacteroidetes bacterium GWF2_33_16]|nr:MAG: peroxiredoxin [Bacteroidetes bacterium GWE2_32_14]OFY02365.1 MAG: peroxiredoxin [Bacteroidetes bacterium GWF2_33_16]